MNHTRRHPLAELLVAWNLADAAERTDIAIHGSPQRCLERHIAETPSHKLFLLEAVPLSRQPRRKQQAVLLLALKANGLEQASPWLPTRNGELGVVDGELFWQLREFLPEPMPLPRERYGLDGWRGKALADILLQLRTASRKLPQDALPRPFSLSHYIQQHLLPEIRDRNPALLRDVRPIVKELQAFFAQECALPLAFAHGDFHPGNLLWGADGVCGIIDWEFCGPKTELYDAANLLGCIGMDDPAWLTAPLARAFLSTLLPAGGHARESRFFLPETIAALRFGWLREWFVQDDRELLCQELDFIWLILDNRSLLREKWNLVANLDA